MCKTQTPMSNRVGRPVFPGNVIPSIRSSNSVAIIGPGLKRNDADPNSLIVTQIGTLCFKAPNTYWVESRQKRYVPKRGDLVVGVVAKKAGDILKVDIGSSEYASLSMLGFEGATKKQKVDVNIGDIVYSKIFSAHKEMEPELVCVDSFYKAGKLGVLSSEGFIFNVSLHMAYRLLTMENPLLRTLGKRFAYEITVGINGKVWVRCNKTADLLQIKKAIEVAERKSDRSIIETCNKVR